MNALCDCELIAKAEPAARVALEELSLRSEQTLEKLALSASFRRSTRRPSQKLITSEIFHCAISQLHS